MRSYVVPYEEGMSLLDCLVKIRELYDPSLAFLYSCRYDNSCKLCLASVNGRVSYLCLTPAEDGTQIRPVPKGKIIRDLVTNIRTMT
ncbi:MAG: 2Fe-2S iron-sulfur cluster-binding protein [Chloroflexi bacterium]|nr:2Fe-2S iron-sulfur cluster-binding protein [Chloroflexota bacterium]